MIGILTDVTKCTGCRRCVEACAQAHGLGKDVPEFQDSPDGLSDRRWTSIVEVSPPDGLARRPAPPDGLARRPAPPDGLARRPAPTETRCVRKHCQHCLEPACVSVCPVGAMHKTPEGPVIYDGGKCMGCRYCMMACPYGIPRYQWEQPVPFVRKCTLCYERLLQGQKPACVEACPEEATIFGERDDLLAEAKRRLRAEPKRYIPKVYGEKEVGGTSVLYVSNVPLDFLGFDGRPGERPLSTEPLPALTWKVLEKVPAVALGMGALMLGTYWVIERRMKIATGEEVTSDE